MASASRIAPWISASISFATPRDARPASSKSSTTASGVTMPAGLRATAWLRYRRARRPPLPAPSWTSTASSPPTRRAGRGSSSSPRRPGGARLGPAEVDELVQLYQRASTHLSHARTQRADPALVARLTSLVANARRRALRHALPLARRRSPGSSPPASRPRCGTPAGSSSPARVLLFVPAILMGAWLARSDAALEASAPTPCARPTWRRTSRPTTPRHRRRSSPPR